LAANADRERVHQLEVSDENGEALLTLPDDVALVEAAFADLEENAGRAIGMLVIDPITAFLSSSTDSHKDASVRRALFPLAALAERRDLAVVVVAHLTKDENRRLLSRITGSGAFVNAARAVLAFARDPEDPEGERGSRRVLVMAATNWGRMAPSLAAHVETTWVPTDDGPTEQPVLVLDGECELSASDLQRGAPEASDDEVADAILLALGSGPRPSAEVKDELNAALRLSRRTVERAASRLEGDELLVRDKAGFPPIATWALASRVDARDVANGKSGANAGDSDPVSANSDTVWRRVADANEPTAQQAFACSCATPGELAPDGRCSRCWGVP
jgi:hypothetical protein